MVELLCERFQLPLPLPPKRAATFRPSLNVLTALRGALRRARDGTPDGGGLGARRVEETLVLAWLRAHRAAQNRRETAKLRVRDRAIRACLERMEQADLIELSPSLLCEIGGVGERTLQYVFRERFGLTPAAFLKARRLAVLRHALTDAQPDENIGDIAYKLGFWHTGQLATDYRRAFGETPSETRYKRFE